MNVLAIDAGNSRIKWGYADDSGWLRRAWLQSADAAAIGEALKGLPAPARIVVSNGAGERVRDALARALAMYSVAPLWVQGCEQQCGVRSGYVTGTCTAVHIGATTHVWDIRIHDDANEKLVCISRLTVAILKKNNAINKEG